MELHFFLVAHLFLLLVVIFLYLVEYVAYKGVVVIVAKLKQWNVVKLFQEEIFLGLLPWLKGEVYFKE